MTTNPMAVDGAQDILQEFRQYSDKFQMLNPCQVLSYYHYPAILISQEKVIAIKNRVGALITIALVMLALKRRGYDHAELKDLSVRQLTTNLAIVSGTVIRYKADRQVKNDTVLEKLELTYTFRKVGTSWKIVVAALYE